MRRLTSSARPFRDHTFLGQRLRPFNLRLIFGCLLRRLKIPILVLRGGRDYQVTNDFDIWKKALANDRRARFKFYPSYTRLLNAGAG